MTERKQPKLSEKTAERLYKMIAEEHRYGAGSKLPNEYDLSVLLEVSRTTLREAISFLVAQQVLEIRRGLGTFVCQDLSDHAMDMTTLQSLHAKERARDLYEMRLIFEPAAVALAAVRASDEELEHIRQKAMEAEVLAANGGDWAAADQAFHLAIIRATHNEYMRRLYPIINEAVAEIMQMLNDCNQAEIQQVAQADNRLILEFLLQRDQDEARHAMSIHMKHLLNTVGTL
ncbi:FCD domain-containing protein [Bengtsoniella intestinalis]|uniref:FadR/GntR family transcriptional regulator n=1 Tax=Bengtsoniella intestinalis TaxID=3073143 RepID=UPI00391F38B7